MKLQKVTFHKSQRLLTEKRRKSLSIQNIQ